MLCLTRVAMSRCKGRMGRPDAPLSSATRGWRPARDDVAEPRDAARLAAGLVDDLEVAHYPFPLVDLDGGAICVDEGVENRKIRGRRPTLDRFILRFGY